VQFPFEQTQKKKTGQVIIRHASTIALARTGSYVHHRANQNTKAKALLSGHHPITWKEKARIKLII